MDVLDHLTQEHRKVEKLMRSLSDTEPGNERDRMVEELNDALNVHMLVEERFLYPVVGEVMDRETAKEAEVEHSLTRDGLLKLQDLASEPGFAAAVEMLQAGVGHHVKDEEGEIFPVLREKAADRLSALDPERLEKQVRADELTRDELYERAKKANISGRSTMSKAELTEAVQQQA